jgi:AraC-like DNA-binding protein
VKGKFDEVNGAAQDIDSWTRLVTSDDRPSIHEVESMTDPTYAGRFRRHHLDQVRATLMQFETGEHTVRRTAKHIQAEAEPAYFVVCQLTGDSVFRQPDGQLDLRAGDFTIASSLQPYQWTLTGTSWSFFTLRFPQSMMCIPPQVARSVEVRALSSREGFGKHLAPFVHAIAHDADLLRGAAGGRLARNLIDLVATGLEDTVQRTGRSRPASLFARVLEYISANLSDPGLDASEIARANHISIRYLQVLFQDRGTTVTDWIRERRLAGARRDLTDGMLRDASIGDIALRWGYPDQAYFARLFRREFGMSPRQWRARATALPGPAQPVIVS